MADKIEFSFKKCPVINGEAYPSIEAGKLRFLEKLFELASDMQWTPEGIAEHIIENEGQIMAVLTLTEDSRPSTRKALGAVRKPRNNKTKAEPEPELPIKAA